MISAFRGKYYFLSNFYAAPVVWDGVSYKNNEAAFQSAKVGREYRVLRGFLIRKVWGYHI